MAGARGFTGEVGARCGERCAKITRQASSGGVARPANGHGCVEREPHIDVRLGGKRDREGAWPESVSQDPGDLGNVGDERTPSVQGWQQKGDPPVGVTSLERQDTVDRDLLRCVGEQAEERFRGGCHREPGL